MLVVCTSAEFAIQQTIFAELEDDDQTQDHNHNGSEDRGRSVRVPLFFVGGGCGRRRRCLYRRRPVLMAVARRAKRQTPNDFVALHPSSV
jgi:hypothetical protein